MEQTYMKEKPILPLLLSMAAPMILSMLVNSLYNIIDSIFVAKISEDAMTALSLVFPIQNVVNSVAVGFGIGINVMIAFCLGANQREQADKAASQGMFLSIVHGIILSITGILIMPSFLKLLFHLFPKFRIQITIQFLCVIIPCPPEIMCDFCKFSQFCRKM